MNATEWGIKNVMLAWSACICRGNLVQCRRYDNGAHAGLSAWMTLLLNGRVAFEPFRGQENQIAQLGRLPDSEVLPL